MSVSKFLERREELLRFIHAHIAENGSTPSAGQISRRLGWPKSACQGYLRRLREELDLPPAQPNCSLKYCRACVKLIQQIQDYTLRQGYAPSVHSLAVMLGLSPNTVRSYLIRLQSEGLVDFETGIPRSIRVKKGVLPDHTDSTEG